MAGFLIRQPVTMIVKIYSGRRTKHDLADAYFWSIVYALIGAVALAGLIVSGYAYVLVLAIPGMPVFVWHLYLVSRHAERRQMGVELVASGVLALTAPAAYWVGVGMPEQIGWLLWLLIWLQSAASIVYAYLRLDQRELDQVPPLPARLRMGLRAILYTSFNLLLAIILSIYKIIPPLLPIPYALQWVESIWGSLYPAVEVKPTRIGIRQLIVSSMFTILFIITWNL